MSLVIIGLDGLDYGLTRALAEKGNMPVLAELMERYSFGKLTCSVYPPYSAPAWTTIFTGLPPVEHEIISFVEADHFEREYGHLPWLWNGIPEAGVAGLPVPIPFYHQNCYPSPTPRDLAIDIPITMEEMMASSEFFRGATKRMIDEERPLIVTIWSAPDRAGHLYWGTPNMRYIYEGTDMELAHLVPDLEKHTFVILSDHGMQSLAMAKRQTHLGFGLYDNEHNRGDHSQNGIIITNAPGPLPAHTNAVYNWLQKTQVHARLQALGYVE